jgi:hypothetical protein
VPWFFMGDLLFKLRYIPTANGKMNCAAIDISRFMGEMGLKENIHYATEPWKGSDNSTSDKLLDHSGEVLLEIYSDNPFWFQDGVLGGCGMVWDFLKKHKREIKNLLKLIENGN